MDRRKHPNQHEKQSDNAIKWLIVPIIGAAALIIVALINGSFDVYTTLKPIEYTQTA